ncbi:MAG: PAS domain-containing protein [Alphaproteobacteria bacterium]
MAPRAMPVAEIVGRIGEFTDDAILITEAEPKDPPGPRIVYANAALSRMTGYSAEELLGQTPRVLQGPGTSAEGRAAIREALRAWKPIVIELLNYRKDRTPFWVEMSIVPIADETGWYRYWIAVQRDTTERRRRETELTRARHLSGIGRATGSIAHDLNNVLTGILGNAEMLEDLAERPQRVRALASAILEAGERAAVLVDRLLSFGRRQQPQPDFIDVRQFVGTLCGELRRSLPSSIEVAERFADAEPWAIYADPGQFAAALLQLGANARDAMPDGGKLTIGVANRPEPGGIGKVEVSVADDGCGMSPEVVVHAFEPFFTTKGASAAGIGLSMVQGFVEQSGGTIVIDSAPGAGARVTIALPRALPPPGSGPVTAAGQRDVLADKTVLVVDDDPMVRQMAEIIIRSAGCTVSTAGNGREALAMLEEAEHFDILFSDVVMPGGINGEQLAAMAVARRPGIAVVLTTGYAEIINGAPVGVDRPNLLRKPYRREDLLAALRSALATTE